MIIEREIRKIKLTNGTIPFDDWYQSVGDKHMQAAIAARLERVRAGNFGNHRYVGDGVNDLKIYIGPGLSVYYAEYRRKIILLLGGGDKSSQQRDIKRSIGLWKQFQAFSKK